MNLSKSDRIAALRDIIKESDNIVFFGGAGVSTESNIRLQKRRGFTAKKGRAVFRRRKCSHTFFMRYTEDFFDYYKTKLVHRDAKPNNAHLALAKLEQMGKLKAIITQNVDGLHQKAGSNEVLELHGSVYRNYCMKCGKFFDLDYVMDMPGVPKCDDCGGTVKPDVVLYEEGLDTNIIDKSIRYISNAEVLIVAGTSLTVYPAAGLIRYFSGKHLVLINKTPTPYDSLAKLVINDSIGETLKACLD